MVEGTLGIGSQGKSAFLDGGREQCLQMITKAVTLPKGIFVIGL